MKRSLVWIGRTAGGAVIVGLMAMVMLRSEKPVVLTANAAVADEGSMPEMGGAVGWLNSAP